MNTNNTKGGKGSGKTPFEFEEMEFKIPKAVSKERGRKVAMIWAMESKEDAEAEEKIRSFQERHASQMRELSLAAQKGKSDVRQK